jgi:ATP-binding cassette subfamily C exporter for protease/lipase
MRDYFRKLLVRSELTAAIFALRRELSIVAALSMLANVLMLAPTLYMLQVFDRVLTSQNELTLLAVSAIALFLYAVMALAEQMRTRVLIIAGVQFDEKLGTRIFAASFDAYLNQAATIAPKAAGDLTVVRQFLTGNGIFAFFDVPWVPVYLAVLYIMHPWLGHMAVVFAFIQAALAWLAHRMTAAPTDVADKTASAEQLFLQSKLRNSEAVESMGMVVNLLEHWRARHHLAIDKATRAQFALSRISAISKFVRYTQQSLALGMGAVLAIDGQITPGAMIASNVLTSRALAPIDLLVNVWRPYFSAREAFFRLEGLLARYPRRLRAFKKTVPVGEVKLIDVVARAPGRNEPILRNVSLDTTPGILTVVMGPSGSGKSTLARVMVGIWSDVRGDVLLDGVAIDSWDRIELGPHIGYLPQDVELFEGTIAENIARFGQVDSAKVIEAAKTTGLHDMILRFPKGYDTTIGESGGMLSGGQRQRIGLARAVYGKPALIVLDEPNANLDEAGENALMLAVLDLKNEGKNIVLVTHRSAAMAATDRLVVMQNGRIQAMGPRDAVLLALQEAKNNPPSAHAGPSEQTSA